ncbi:MAG: VOC family protein [Pirellulales bacterium]|nr:VOC family protein [Pirellulales bacterium]
MIRQKIKTFLWYDRSAEEAANFYCSLFKDSQVNKVTRYPKGAPAPEGTAMTVEFQLAGIEFVALNGGPHFKFTEAISLSVDCESQAEVDHLWSSLTQGGQPSQCGWLKDRYGLSWQIVPRALPELLASKDAAKSGRVMQAMLQMSKIDIAELQRAADGN